MALFAIAAMRAQMPMPTLPQDTAVRIGKLPNGLTYYIRHNNWPEHRAEFYIAQKVGSLQENDDQRGLAHFLEHMCFNGTKHFKGNDLIRYCESIGVKFGRDLNAYTAIDQTVYNISNVPTTRQSALDSCLLILYDWADGLTLDPKEIDKERGVINEEKRWRTGAQMRMFERNLPRLYPGSKYGERLPIGLMSIVNTFKPKVLQDYYEKWYRPDNQGIIVVGDVDVNHVEAEIKKLFGPIKLPANPAKVETEAVPDNPTPIVVVDKDKEQQVNIVKLMFKHDPFPDSLKNTVAYLVNEYVIGSAVSMLNARLQEVAQQADCPFVQAQAGYGQYIYARTKDALEFAAAPKDGQTAAALKAVMCEALRAARFGFTATEYNRDKASTESLLDKMYSNKDKQYNASFCSKYVDNFLGNEPIPSIDDYYTLMKQIVPNIPLEAVNMVIRELVSPSDTNVVVLNFNTEKDGAVYPTEAGLTKALDEARAEKLEAYVDKVKDEPLLKTLPAKGRIVKESRNDRLGYTALTLSNGVKVVLKKTDFKKDEVLLSGEGFGGASLYGKTDFANLKLFDDVVEASGLGDFSHTELEKALAGKIVSVSLGMSDTREMISGSSTPKDVETMLQLVYLYFTKINKDQASFDNLMKTMEISLKNKALSPENAFMDSLTVTSTMHNPRFAPLTLADLKNVGYDRILQIARERTANAAAYTFRIIGNYDEATIRPLIEQYLGSLPSQKKIVKGHRVDTDAKGIVVNSFKRRMQTPKATAVMLWSSDKTPYTLDDAVRASMAGQVLNMIYLDKIREQASAAYTVSTQGSLSRIDDKTDAGLFVYCPVKPEKCDTALSIMRSEAEALAGHCDADLLAKVKEYMLKNHADRTRTNGYWNDVISNYMSYGADFYTDYRKTVEAQTPAAISAFMTGLLKAGNRIEVVMMPEE